MVKKRHKEEIKESHKKTEDVTFKFSKKNIKCIIYAVAAIVIVIAAYFLIKPLITGNIAYGDTVDLQFTFESENGTPIGDGESSFKLGTVYSELGFSSEKIDKEIKSMEVGEEKTIILNAADAFGEYDKTKITSIDRVKEVNKTFTAPLNVAYFKEQFNKSPAVGDKIPVTQFWNATIIAFDKNTNESILKHDIDKEMTIPLEIDGTVTISVRGDKILFKYNPIKQMLSENGVVNVIEVAENSILVDSNVPFAGQKIKAVITLVNVQKAQQTGTKTDKPSVELFVMSYCPYGVEAQKVLIPVANLLGDKIDARVRFVYYAMHGQKELDENLVQYCIQEKEPAKYWDYLSCFTSSQDSASCLSSAGINKANVDKCIQETDTKFKITEKYNDQSTWLSGRYPLFEVEKSIGDKYSVEGSETMIINGAKISPADYRWDADKLKTLICNTFSKAPAECSQTLSSSSSSGPSSGSCS